MSTTPLWEILRTRARQEKIVARALQHLHVEHWLPLTRTYKRYGEFDIAVEEPQYPGFIFIRISAEEHRRLLKDESLAGRAAEIDPARISEAHKLRLSELIDSLKAVAPSRTTPIPESTARDAASASLRNLLGSMHNSAGSEATSTFS